MSVATTRMQDWIQSAPNFDKNMTRAKEWGALDFFTMQTTQGGLLSPELREKAFNSMGNTVKIPVINFDENVTVSNVRSCVIQDDENTSAFYTVVWATYAVGFTSVPVAFDNNYIGYDQDFGRKLEKISRALADALDTSAITALTAQKTQVFNDLLNYTAVGNVIDVPSRMATEILGDIRPIMRANNFSGQMHLIGNAGLDSLIGKLSEKGVYNEANKRLQYADKILHYTTNIANESGKNGTFFAVEDGNVAVLTRVDREARRGTKMNDHEWGVVRLPYIDLPVGFHFYKTVGDQSAIAGDATADVKCAVKEHFGFSLDAAFITAYNSNPTTLPNPIIKAQIAALPANTPLGTPVEIVNGSENPLYTQTV